MGRVCSPMLMDLACSQMARPARFAPIHGLVLRKRLSPDALTALPRTKTGVGLQLSGCIRANLAQGRSLAQCSQGDDSSQRLVIHPPALRYLCVCTHTSQIPLVCLRSEENRNTTPGSGSADRTQCYRWRGRRACGRFRCSRTDCRPGGET